MPFGDDTGELLNDPLASLGLGRGVRPRRVDLFEEAANGSGVARRAIGIHLQQDSVRVTVGSRSDDVLVVAGRVSLVPELLARPAPEPRIAALQRSAYRLGVHVSNHQYFASVLVLHDGRY